MVSVEEDGKAVPALAAPQLRIIHQALQRHFKGNISALAREADLDRSRVSRVINGQLGPGMFMAIRLADALQVSRCLLVPGINPAEVFAPPPEGDVTDMTALISQLRQQFEEARGADRLTRLYEWASAGDPRDGTADAIGYYPIPPGREAELGRRGFALRVRGDSMAGYRRGILDGSVVFVNPDGGWNVSDAVVASVDGTGLIVKQVWKDANGIEFLRSCPANGERCAVAGTHYRVVGKVVFWVNVHDPDDVRSGGS
jgi:SOS-response transcriptional repressor LexA